MKMAQCKQTAYEFIQECFSPMVAVLCSTDAELVCMKNNLSFVELVQPFSRLSSEGKDFGFYFVIIIKVVSIIIDEVPIRVRRPHSRHELFFFYCMAHLCA